MFGTSLIPALNNAERGAPAESLLRIRKVTAPASMIHHDPGASLPEQTQGACGSYSVEAEIVEWTPVKDAIAEPRTKHGIEAARRCASAPPGSLLDPHSVVAFPLNSGVETWRGGLE
jgi:hypothetical protein